MHDCASAHECIPIPRREIPLAWQRHPQRTTVTIPSAADAELELIRAVVEQAPDAIIVTDTEGAIRIWNDRARAIFGFSKTEAVAGGLDLIIPDNLRPAHWRGFQAAVAAGKAKSEGRSALTRAVHKDGHKLYVELSFGIVTDRAGSPLGALAIARDVTQRHPAGSAQRNQK